MHGSPLGAEEIRAAKENLGWPSQEPFFVPEEALRVFRSCVGRGKERHAEWDERFAAYEKEFANEAAEMTRMIEGRLPDGWTSALPTFGTEKGLATRVASGEVLNAIATSVPELVGGSADLAPSTGTYLKGYPDIGTEEFSGRNFHFGVREHAMGSVMNGIAAHGSLRPYGGTFFVFSDYMRPPVRMAAIMELPVIYVWTHDSIGLGEDGPTHQPIEHLASLRAMPGLVVIRPADANETALAWRAALERTDGPTALVLSRQTLPVLADVPRDAVANGAWIVEDGDDIVLIGTGSEVQLCLFARGLLSKDGIAARVVSMPSWELFRAQDQRYRDEVLPARRPRLAVEAASSFGWCAYADATVSLDHFGASAPAEDLWREFGFTSEAVAASARELLASRG